MKQLKAMLLLTVPTLFLGISDLYPQEVVDQTGEVTSNETPDVAAPEDGAPQQTVEETTKPEPQPVVTPPKNTRNIEKINNQFRFAPEDPSLLYETRNIPDNQTAEEYLPPKLEKEVINERIEEERDFRESLSSIKIRIPDPLQILVILGIIILFMAYRVSYTRRNPNSGRKRL